MWYALKDNLPECKSRLRLRRALLLVELFPLSPFLNQALTSVERFPLSPFLNRAMLSAASSTLISVERCPQLSPAIKTRSEVKTMTTPLL